jgi:branched-chain amino acid transport system ATP-binding protein
MLELSQLHVHQGPSHVLHGIDLCVGAGEIVGLFGRNGAGKTTLLKTVSGWLAPSRGTLRFAGHELGGLPPERICRLGIRFCPEDRRIFPGLTVDENLRLGLLQDPVRGAKERQRAVADIYERLPQLAARRRQLGTTLSGGEQQLLALARVLLGKPRLLLIDEPTEGLAPRLVDVIFGILAQLRSAGVAVLLVEQKVQRAFEVCGPIYAIERGRIVFRGDAARAADREQLLTAITI